MLQAVEGLIAELRRVGLPVRVSESIDAVAALRHTDLADREQVKAALRACLVKDAQHLGAFDTVFDLFFSVRPQRAAQAGPAGAASGEQAAGGGPAGTGQQGTGGEGAGCHGNGAGGGGGLAALDDGAIRQLLIRALREDDRYLARVIAGIMVDRHARIAPGRPVAGTYYLLRTMQAAGPETLVTALATGAEPGGESPAGESPIGGLARRLAADQARTRVEQFRQEVEAQVRRRLVADRGAAAVARTLRIPLPEDVSFLTASQQEIAALRTVLAPLSRKLASRLARSRRHRGRGQLDFRRTMRESMSYGGVLAAPVFRRPRPAKPELVVLADISGSVATFATFTLHLVSALRQEFAAVRSFVFVDGVDEVTALLAGAASIADAARQINAAGSGIWLDGRSDYGHALAAFWEGWGGQLRHRSTVLVLGDARTNYHPPRADVLAAIAQHAGHLYWLNPEPVAAWDTGDSVIGRYAPACDAVIECRTVRQLRAFVESLAA